MTELKTLTFTDSVKKMGKNPEKNEYTVLFKRHAAFYSLDENNSAAIEVLTRSAQEALQVNVVSEAARARIIEASLA